MFYQKVSAVIPCFNQGNFIDDAVNSLLTQSFAVDEIIIINDGSTDSFTNQKLKNYDKPRTKVIVTANQGLAAARNLGIKTATGDYIIVLDADDEFDKSFVYKAVNILNTDKKIAVVSSWVIGFGSNDFFWKMKGGASGDFLYKNNSVSAAIFRKSVWEMVGGYDEMMVYGGEDWDFWIKITGLGFKIHIIPEPLFFYRQKEHSMRLENYNHLDRIFNSLFDNNKRQYQVDLKELVINKLFTTNTIKQTTTIIPNRSNLFVKTFINKQFIKLRKLNKKLWIRIVYIIKQRKLFELAKGNSTIEFSLFSEGFYRTEIKNLTCKSRSFERRYINDIASILTNEHTKYDLVILNNVVGYSPNPLKLLSYCKNLFNDGGYILVIIPHKNSNLNYRRPVTTLEHLISDFNSDTKEDDITHYEEILNFYDYKLDDRIGDIKELAKCLNNNKDEVKLEYHVFNILTSVELMDYAGYKIVDVFLGLSGSIFIIAKCTGTILPDNRQYLQKSHSLDFKAFFN